MFAFVFLLHRRTRSELIYRTFMSLQRSLSALKDLHMMLYVSSSYRHSIMFRLAHMGGTSLLQDLC
jgi:hypothetical protein